MALFLDFFLRLLLRFTLRCFGGFDDFALLERLMEGLFTLRLFFGFALGELSEGSSSLLGSAVFTSVLRASLF